MKANLIIILSLIFFATVIYTLLMIPPQLKGGILMRLYQYLGEIQLLREVEERNSTQIRIFEKLHPLKGPYHHTEVE